MKNKLFLIFIALSMLCVQISNAAAQDYTQFRLPEGAKARLGKGTIREITYSPDGSRLAAVGGIGIWIYDTLTLQEVDFLTTHMRVSNVTYNPDGKTLASGSTDGTVLLWNVTSFGQQESESAEVTTRPKRDGSPDVTTLLPMQRVEVESDRSVESRNTPPDRANLGRRNNTSNLDRLLSASGGNTFMFDGKRRGLFLGIEAGVGVAAWRYRYYGGLDSEASPAFTMNFKIGYGSSEQTLFYMKGGLSTSGIVTYDLSDHDFFSRGSLFVDLNGSLGFIRFHDENSRFYYHGSLGYVLSGYRRYNGIWNSSIPFRTLGVSGGIGYELSPGFNFGVALDYYRWDVAEYTGERYHVLTFSVTLNAHLY